MGNPEAVDTRRFAGNVRAFLVAGAVVAFLIAILQPFVYTYQAQLIFYPGHAVNPTPDERGWSYEEVWLDVRWRKTHGWYIHADDARGTVLYSHGNGGSVASCLDEIEVYRSLGFDVFLYDYGGFGASTGRPSEYRCYADIRAAWKYLTEIRGIAAGKIVLVGRSLGSGPSCELAASESPAGLLLESAFHSIAKIAEEEFPNNPLRYLLWHKFDNAAKVNQITCPVLFIHGQSDRATPLRHAKQLYDAVSAPRTFVELRGGHNSAYVMERDVYESALVDFMKTIFPQ